MKKFELPEMNISMFDAESVTMLSATGKAKKALETTGELGDATTGYNYDVTSWDVMV